jgi:hypothetical protein
LTQVLHLKFQHWGRVTHSLSGTQQVAHINCAKLLSADLLAVRQWSCNLFWTDDESWILWNSQRSISWLTVEQELPVSVRQTIETPRSILTVFFNLNNFSIVDLLP